MGLCAQTLHVAAGNITYSFPAADAGTMTITNSSAITICGREYLLADISRMYVDDAQVEAATVAVTYDGTTATVTVAGDVARYITAATDGAHVTISQSDDLDTEITYSLSGTSSDGAFTLNGSYKATIELRGLTLTNPSGPALDIQDGKRIEISVKSGTVNTLADGSGGTHKGCVVVKGHAEFKGKGTLNVQGNTAHAIFTKEYCEVKNCTINVTGAVKDGINANQYFLMESGDLTITGVGDDGIQVSYKDTSDREAEDTGTATIEGGTVSITTTAAGSKGIKAENCVVMTGGKCTVTSSGLPLYDGTDVSYVASVKAGVDVTVAGGTLNISNASGGGRGISADGTVTISEASADVPTAVTITMSGNGGTSAANTSGGTTSVSDTYTPKGIKGETSVSLLGGTITITATGTGGKGIKSSGTYTQGQTDGSGPVLTVSTSGSSAGGSSGGGRQWAPRPAPMFAPGGGGWGPGGGGWGPGGSSGGGGSAKAIKVQGTAVLYGGTTEVSTKTSGAEGLESKTSVDIRGGRHYFACYDDCINSSGKIFFNGGVTVCYSNGNDAVDSNAGQRGAITIGNGAVFAFTTKGSPEEGLDCDNNSYIQITGTGIGISAGGAQGGGSSSSISGAAQGYRFLTSSVAYSAGRYYTLSDAQGNNLVTYSFPASLSSTLSLLTATGMKSGSTYYIKYSTTAPTDASTAFHGLYLGSTAVGTSSLTSFSAQ